MTGAFDLPLPGPHSAILATIHLDHSTSDMSLVKYAQKRSAKAFAPYKPASEIEGTCRSISDFSRHSKHHEIDEDCTEEIWAQLTILQSWNPVSPLILGGHESVDWPRSQDINPRIFDPIIQRQLRLRTTLVKQSHQSPSLIPKYWRRRRGKISSLT